MQSSVAFARVIAFAVLSLLGTVRGNDKPIVANGDIIHLRCAGHIEGPRWLDGNTRNRTTALVGKCEGFPGTRWQVTMLPNNCIYLKCLGDRDRAMWLDGNTVDGRVGLAQNTDQFSGTRWKLQVVNSNSVQLQCLGHLDGPRWLDGDTGKGLLSLKHTVRSFSGTRWEIVKDDTAPRLARTDTNRGVNATQKSADIDKNTVTFLNQLSPRGPLIKSADGKVLRDRLAPTVKVRIFNCVDHDGKTVKYEKELMLAPGTPQRLPIPAKTFDIRIYTPNGSALCRFDEAVDTERRVFIDDAIYRAAEEDIAMAGKRGSNGITTGSPLADEALGAYFNWLKKRTAENQQAVDANRDEIKKTGYQPGAGVKSSDGGYWSISGQGWEGFVVEKSNGQAFRIKIHRASPNSKYVAGRTYDFFESEFQTY